MTPICAEIGKISRKSLISSKKIILKFLSKTRTREIEISALGQEYLSNNILIKCICPNQKHLRRELSPRLQATNYFALLTASQSITKFIAFLISLSQNSM